MDKNVYMYNRCNEIKTEPIPKKCKSGTYKITVKAAGNAHYKPGSNTVKIIVKK